MARAPTPEDPWLVARNCYLRDLDKEEQELFETASPENLFDSTNSAQKRHEEQSKSRAMLKKIQPFVDCICQFGEALDVYSNAYPIAIAPVWGSIRVLLHVN